MSEIIQKWITNCIGLVMNMDPKVFAADVMDGTILAQILRSYHIINQDQFISIVPTDNSGVAFKNLKKIGFWLNTSGINCLESDLFDVSVKKGSTSIKLFYKIYLALQDKDKLHYSAERRGKERLHQNDNRFEITHVDETGAASSDSDHPLSKPLVLRKDVIDWNKNRYQTLLDNYEIMREKYAKYIQDRYGITYRDKFTKIKIEPINPPRIDETNKAFPEKKDCTYEELIEEEKHATQMERFVENPKVTKKIVNTLKQKHRRERKENETKLYQHRILLMEMWEKILSNQEKEFEETISKKLLKQSEFEKQMAIKMFEVRQQKQIMLENRRFMDDEIMKKREAEFLEHVFSREKNIGDAKYNYYFERDRTIELHRRIYAEKMRLKSERYHNMCKDIVTDLVNISIRHTEFKQKFNEEVPEQLQKQWTNLFIKQQPIFDLLDDIEDIVQDTNNLPEKLEEIYRIEIHRQNDLDQRDFENYLYLEWPWKLEELLTNFEETLQPLEFGMNVLGHAAHQMLLAKYPKPKPPPKPDIPKVEIAVCINGLPDTSILPVLQTLIFQKGVRIIEIQEAINFCLDAYKSDISTEYVDDNLMNQTNALLEELASNKAKSPTKLPQKGEKPKASKGNEKTPESAEPNTGLVDKQCQTPKIYPCEEIVLSFKGELGKTAYDLLNTGEQLTDSLIVAMFMEYLHSLKDINGWALINYPTTIEQAALLEQALTGKKIPGLSDEVILYSSISIGDIADLKYRDSQPDQEKKNALLRKSRILPNPNPPQEEPEYETFLTAYIRVQPKLEEKEYENDNLGIEPEYDEERKAVEILDKFYTEQGCNYTFYYKTFDVATIKHLGKLIIGDYSIPPKTSLELFGEALRYIEATMGKAYSPPKNQSKSEKAKPKSPDSAKSKLSDKGGKPRSPDSAKSKRSDVIVEIVKVDKETQMPELPQTPETPPADTPSEFKAGEYTWQYTDLPFPDHFQVALGTIWENTEDVYVCDFKELFFIKRIILNAVVPYLTQVRQHMEIFIARPDDKQNYLHQFQRIYNEIDADLRDDEELKSEVHCRIAELREKLWEICDRHMKESEEERSRIIRENWIVVQACELINNYTTAIQLEIDRTCDSFQFLTDYYHGLITKMPSEETPLQKSLLNKLEFNRNSSVTSFGDNAQTIVNDILIIVDSESLQTPFHQAIIQSGEIAMNTVNKWKSIALGALVKFDSLFNPESGKKDKPAPAGKGKDDKKGPKSDEPDPEVIAAGQRLLAEWKCAINGECLRAKLRIDILVKRGQLDLNDILNHSKKIFYNIYNDIRDRYNREIHSVDTACEVLAAALEAEMPLQPELILDGDKFYINPNVLLFPQELPEPLPSRKEKEDLATFTLYQLEVFRNILMDLAPNASIPERAFVYLLQDIIIQNAEDGKESMVPLLWKRLQPNLVSQLSTEIFGDVEFLDWRDFIIYNLCIEFPTEDELIAVRKQCREHDPDSTETIKDYQFYTINLWFENSFFEDDTQEKPKLDLIKKLLFKLFRINDDTINYTALLLAFCKDADPVKGFAKALTLALGKYVCWDTTIGKAFVANLREQRFLDEQLELERQRKRAEAVACAESVITAVVNSTVHLCESLVIEDYKSQKDLIEGSEEASCEILQKRSSSHGNSVSSNNSEKILKELYTNKIDTSESVIKSQEMLLMEEEFTNVEIGFQPTYSPPKVYFMPFEVLLTVFTASLPWHARTQTVNNESVRQQLEAIYYNLKTPEFENYVLTHEILNDSYFKELLWSNSKFIAKNPPKIVKWIVSESCGVCCGDT